VPCNRLAATGGPASATAHEGDSPSLGGRTSRRGRGVPGTLPAGEVPWALGASRRTCGHPTFAGADIIAGNRMDGQASRNELLTIPYRTLPRTLAKIYSGAPGRRRLKCPGLFSNAFSRPEYTGTSGNLESNESSGPPKRLLRPHLCRRLGGAAAMGSKPPRSAARRVVLPRCLGSPVQGGRARRGSFSVNYRSRLGCPLPARPCAGI